MRKTTGPRFCYDCGKQLRGNHKILLIHKIDEHPRTFHKSCAKDALKRKPYSWREYETLSEIIDYEHTGDISKIIGGKK